MWIVWPAFLGACALEVLVFAVVDPTSLHEFEQPLMASRQGIYTIAFFAFWLILVATGSLTVFLSQPLSDTQFKRPEAD